MSDGAINGCDRFRKLEAERLEVEEGLSFVWHRPPIEEVKRQAGEEETVRIFLNGCFDLMHAGHFNALRQAKQLFYQKGYKKVVLVAGIHSDAAITGQKGPPLMNDEERIEVLRATKWVDEFVTDLPYVSMSVRMADTLHVRWICHGDDLPIVNSGGGMYSDAIEKGRFQKLKRTEGISTTAILHRLLQCTVSDVGSSDTASQAPSPGSSGADSPLWDGPLESAMTTTQRLAQFAAPADPGRIPRSLQDASSVVYVQGTFDLLHPGHTQLLEQAAQMGDFLLVGLHSDETVRRHRGRAPILTLLERAMAVLAMHVVDDVVLGVPWEVGRELITTMNVSVVVAGNAKGTKRSVDLACSFGEVVEVETDVGVTSETLRRRAAQHAERLEQRNAVMLHKEAQYVASRSYVPEC